MNFLVVFTHDDSAQSVKSLNDVLITTVNLFAVVDATDAVGGEGSDEQGNTCADIWRIHVCSAEFVLAVEADDGCAVRVTKNDLRAHFF